MNFPDTMHPALRYVVFEMGKLCTQYAGVGCGKLGKKGITELIETDLTKIISDIKRVDVWGENYAEEKSK